ncbi:MAG TPA: helicase-exonuclease AddAB subunit AddA [Pseudogracilibacillus sp.]|nr:helicase-exonuclease AddAB subunit AddA [Pseudogracilibacillus sp.]
MVTWTKEQQEAIDTSGKHLLVAAAAGSGKTAVLVERIIQKIIRKENPMNIDDIFVSTFTNAAAEEMRNRIGQALEKEIQKDPASYHLKKQLSLLQRAQVSTLHSFCTNVVRQYAYMLDIDPGFRIGDEMEMDLIRQEVIDELLEDAYSREGEAVESFYKVVDMFSDDRSDENIGDIILDLYRFSNEYPWPETWLKEQVKVYELEDDVAEESLPWLELLKKHVKEELEGALKSVEKAIEIAREPDGPYQYFTMLESDMESIEKALEKVTGWDEIQVFMQDFGFLTLSSKKTECNEDKKKLVKKIRDQYKKDINSLREELFKRDLAHHLTDMRTLAPVIKELMSLAIDFKERFMAVKKEKAIVDFSDLEHYCLEILLDSTSTPDKLIPSTIAKQYQKRFKEVFVDEYQDINIVQEAILSAVSSDEQDGNMFMVGDVKQSIYRFRHAEPQLFIDKYRMYSENENKGIKIDLAKNFRSRKDVLSGANYVFRQIFDETLGEIDYDEKSELIYGNLGYEDFPLDDHEVELSVIDKSEDPEEKQEHQGESLDDLHNTQLEARAYTEKIKEWIGQKDKPPLKVIDKKTNQKRDIQYRDIVILKRSMTNSSVIMDEFKKQGIPVYAEMRTGYFAAIEVQIMINLLKIIDNPHQDIPIASVLKSPIVGLSEDELAQIRLTKSHVSYFSALKAYVEKEQVPKLNHFLNQLTSFQILAKEGALSELIWHIYTVTGYYDFVGGIPGGRQRQANLRALYDRARGYESTSFRGLFRFLRFIERIDEEGKDLGEAPALSEQEDVVRMMTIHKSKGLEFPVVIIGGMSKEFQFVRSLSKKPYLLDKDLGFATKFIDPVKRITYPTLYYTALKLSAKNKQMAEEMRVLYVAMTRAKEKLVMIGDVKDGEKTKDDWQQVLDHDGWVLPLSMRKRAKSFLDWVGPSLIRHQMNDVFRDDNNEYTIWQEAYQDPTSFKLALLPAETLLNITGEQESAKTNWQQKLLAWDSSEMGDNGHYDTVDKILSFKYNYQKAAKTRAKESVTEIKRRQEVMDESSSRQFLKPFQASFSTRPRFMQEDHRLSSAEIGTAMHTVMQHIPLTAPLDQTEMKSWLEKWIAEEKLTEQEAKAIDIKAITHFLSSDMARFIFNSKYVEREVPFTYTLKAHDIYPDWEDDYAEEKVMIQGVIDCLIHTDKGMIILDYKTDNIPFKALTEEKKIALKDKYRTQLSLYKQAIEDIFNQPVEATYLYFFAKDLLLEM